MLWSCSDQQPSSQETSPVDRHFSTQSTITKTDNIRIGIGNGAILGSNFDPSSIEISPAIEGEWIKLSDTELVFTQDKNLTSGQQYAITLPLVNIDNLVSNQSSIKLSVGVIEQDFELFIEEIKTDETSEAPALQITGRISTADYESNDRIESMLKAEVPVHWTHTSGTGHLFTLSKIERKADSYHLNLSFDGSLIGVSKTESKSVEIPSLKDFKILSSRISENPPYLSLSFSDPIQKNQDLTGLITLEDDNNPKFVINGNEIQMYLSGTHNGTKTVTLYPGIKNEYGYELTNTIKRSVAFDAPNPELKLSSAGNILPSTDGLFLPFESIGLKSVHVMVVKVHESTIPQYFQINQINGEEELKRVGNIVHKEQISLEGQAQFLNEWNRFTLDLSDLFKAEKGALYQVFLSMRPDDSAFPCDTPFETTPSTQPLNTEWSIYKDDGFSAWGNYSNYYYPNGYQWSQRNNPCHVSYYNNQRTVKKTLLASDIGLMAKIGSNNSLLIATTSLSSASPVQSDIQVLDYQLQALGSGQTTSEGFFEMFPERRPFIVIASVGEQKSYLKLDDGSSLSISNFDASGQRVNKDLKGFIYGERGVWRPGDDIYLSFMLDDPEQTIPTNHPVKMTLRDPRGNLKDEQVNSDGTNGIYTFQTKSQSDDLTGNWLATVTVGNNTFTKRIKIETVKPNRLKINLEFPDTKFYKSDGPLAGTMDVKWLTGLTAPNLLTQVQLTLSPIKTSFDNFPNFNFDLSNANFISDPITIVDKQLDENGRLGIMSDMPSTKGAPGALRARLEVKAYEPGGNFSIYGKSLTYLPYESFVGLRVPEGNEYGYLGRDQLHQFDLAKVSDKGQPLNGAVEIQVYKLSWRWWWDQYDDYEASYVLRNNETPLMKEKIDLSNGRGKVNIDGTKLKWGRHLMVVTDLQSGHKASSIFYMGWTEGEQSGLGASFLSVTTDKTSYEVGEKIQVKLPSSVSGKALIAIENGSKVLDKFWIDTQQPSTDFSIDATEEMTPNVYLNVTLLQPHASTENDLPIRTYGLQPIKIYNPKTILKPILSMSEELAPGKQVTIEVTEQSKQKMSYTLAVVDEGLLDITAFNTPSPWDHFYQKEALGVKTWDMYDQVMGAFGARLERLLAIGGGGDLESDKKSNEANRFDPVVQFMGPFTLDAGGSNTHSFEMPQYIGSVKTMLVASNDAGAYGMAEKVTPVIQPLMVLGTMPRVIGPGESIALPVNLFKFKDEINTAQVSITAEGVLSLTGPSSKRVSFNSATETESFQLKVHESIGAGKITILAKSGNETAEHIINIESRLPNPSQTKVMIKRIEAGESLNGKVDIFGLTGTNEATLSLSTLPPLNLEKRLKYLIRYPHGCIEQTTSSIFPQLYLSGLVELTNQKKVQIESNIKDGIKRFGKFQTHEGGFAYWSGNSDPNHWGTSYAVHFLVEAQKAGFFVPAELLKKALKFQSRLAKNWARSNQTYNDDITQAYRLYTLALAGNSALSAMNRMRNESDISSQALYRLAAAYAITGQQEVAKSLSIKAKSSNKLSRQHYWHSYGSDQRDMAMLLETHVALEAYEDAFELINELSQALSSDIWMSTQTTAYSLLAIGKFVASQDVSGSIQAKVVYDGKLSTWSTQQRIISESLNTAANEKSINIQNTGNAVIFATITSTGTPMPGNEEASEKDLKVSVRYLQENGAPMGPTDLKVGESMKIEVKTTNVSGRTVKDIALSHILPSGWEINNIRLNDVVVNESGNFDYQDIRDDRTYTYFDLRRGESRSFTTFVTSSYTGKFYLPSVQAEAMYDASKQARTAGQWITVNPRE
ncbi:MAG: hypothetical protein JXQ90_02255 [Cyclobacteriaceae bacterium]